MIRNIVFDMGMVLLDHDPLLPCIRHAGYEHAQELCDAIFWHQEWGRMIDGGVMDEQGYVPTPRPASRTRSSNGWCRKS